MLYSIMRFLSRWVLRFAFRMKVTSSVNIPSEGPLVLAANHESNLDGFVLVSAFTNRRLTFLSASYLFDELIIGTFLRVMGALPVKKQGTNVGSLKKAIAILEEGGTVAVFPEGGIVGSEILGGAVYLALKANAPILPLHIAGTERALPPGRRLPSLCPIEVSIGSPFHPSGPEGANAGVKESVSEGRKVLERVLAEMCSSRTCDEGVPMEQVSGEVS